ncbi:Chaperonin 10 Kd subunit, putative [Entamoeba histolytica]
MSLLSPQPISTRLTGLMAKIKPTGDMVLVQHYTTQTVNGIILAEQKNDKFQQGMVVSINTDNNPMKLKIGNHVIFGGSPATTFIADKKSYSLLKQHDIFAKIE